MVLQNASSAAATESAQSPIILQSSGQTIAQNPVGNVQIIQQIVTPNGEIQQIPVSRRNTFMRVAKMNVPDSTHTTTIANDQAAAAREQLAAVNHSSPNHNKYLSASGTSRFIASIVTKSKRVVSLQVAQQNGGSQQVFLTQANNAADNE